ncbi:Late embryogenesis abundant hydroxyproline-rich glycoprotein family protein [Hirschfeldia incana]|nr:Late embryogenesis abundant hydroxyproline-rich glycoprotein family protein [Hirschfeldia incana]
MAAAEMFLKPVLQKPPGYHELHAPPETPNALSSSSTLRRRPPKYMIPPSFYPDKKKKWSRCRLFCCCFCITLAVLILLLIITVSVFFLWYSPRLPVVRLASFRVSNFNFSNGKPGDLHLTTEASARLDFRNPNGKLQYYYGDADVAVSVGDGDYETSLGSTKVKGFVQKQGNRTVVIVPVKAKRQEVDDPTVKRLRAEMKIKKLVVKVTAKMKLGLAVGRSKIVTLGITLSCGGVTLQMLDKQMAKCTITMLKWYVLLLPYYDLD